MGGHLDTGMLELLSPGNMARFSSLLWAALNVTTKSLPARMQHFAQSGNQRIKANPFSSVESWNMTITLKAQIPCSYAFN